MTYLFGCTRENQFWKQGICITVLTTCPMLSNQFEVISNNYADFAGTKALRRTLQLYKDVEHALCVCWIFMSCASSRLHLQTCASQRYAKAQRRLDFLVDTAIRQGREVRQGSPGDQIALYARGIQCAGREGDGPIWGFDPKAMAALDPVHPLLASRHQPHAIRRVLQIASSTDKDLAQHGPSNMHPAATISRP